MKKPPVGRFFAWDGAEKTAGGRGLRAACLSAVASAKEGCRFHLPAIGAVLERSDPTNPPYEISVLANGTAALMLRGNR